MRTITNKKAIELCRLWHGGQWSALYQFSSSGMIIKQNALWYIEEILQEMYKPETSLIPFIRSQKDRNELIKLKNYFLNKLDKINISISFKNDFYGFPFPYLVNDDNEIYPIKRLQ